VSRPRAVTLDATGTLIACPAMPDIYTAVLARHGIVTTPEEVRRLFPVVWKELDCLTPPGRDRFTSFEGGSRAFWSRLVDRLCELIGTPEPGRGYAGTAHPPGGAPPGPFAAAELFHRFSLPEAWVVFPDAVPALETLRSLGLRLAVISNFDERLPSLLAGLGLEQRVDLVVPSSSLGLAKPNPRLFRHVLERLEVDPGSALHVGDHRLEDVEGAQAAGMEAMLLDRRRRRAPGAARDLLEVASSIERRLDGGSRSAGSPGR
jgi:putative hydrolase of the HAD superfamily